MYPELHDALSNEAGALAAFTKSLPENTTMLDEAQAKRLRAALLDGREASSGWYKELEQWRADVHPASECAPEMFNVLATEF